MTDIFEGLMHANDDKLMDEWMAMQEFVEPIMPLR